MVILGDYANRYLLLLPGQESREGVGYFNCCAVVRGTTILKIAVLLIATTTTSTTTTTILVFGLFVVVRRAFFCTRTGGWEFVGRVKEESRPVPVMSVSQRCGRVSLNRRLRTRRVTASENQTGLGSLVGVKAEDLPNSYARGFYGYLGAMP
jgi:hypothetical protein